MKQELAHELDEVMAGLDEYCRSGGRTLTKAIDGDEEDDRDAFPSTVEGLAAFAQSAEMRARLRDDPETFRTEYLNFVLGRELVAKGLVTPAQVGIWSQQLAMLQPVRTHARSTPSALSKAVQHAEYTPRPWEFEATPRGLEGFIHSEEMQALVRERPSLYRRLFMDFYAAIMPAPLPQDISAKRQELEMLYPDDPTRSTVSKAMTPGARLTTGQSILISNFGPSIGDPDQWLSRR